LPPIIIIIIIITSIIIIITIIIIIISSSSSSIIKVKILKKSYPCNKLCEMLRISHCIDSRLVVGGKFDSLKRRPRSTP
jgi:hypothetical protein